MGSLLSNLPTGKSGDCLSIVLSTGELKALPCDTESQYYCERCVPDTDPSLLVQRRTSNGRTLVIAPMTGQSPSFRRRKCPGMMLPRGVPFYPEVEESCRGPP